MECPRCGEDMIYTEDKDIEVLGWVTMDCPNGCENGYLVPIYNPNLVKE